MEIENNLSCHPNRLSSIQKQRTCSNEFSTTTTVIKRLTPKWMINPSFDTNLRCMQHEVSKITKDGTDLRKLTPNGPSNPSKEIARDFLYTITITLALYSSAIQ